MVMYIEKRPLHIQHAVAVIEESGTSLWGLTAYDVFARSADKETWIVKDGVEIVGVIFISTIKKEKIISLLAKKNFNPKTFLMCWQRLESHYIGESSDFDDLGCHFSMKIVNLQLQKIALRLGFKKKDEKFVFSKNELKEKNESLNSRI